MNSPHVSGYGAYEDPFSNRKLPPEEEKLIEGGYLFLGWANSMGKPKEFVHCMDMGHNYHSAFPNAWQSVRHTPSGSDTTQWCTKCKIYWKVDMS